MYNADREPKIYEIENATGVYAELDKNHMRGT